MLDIEPLQQVIANLWTIGEVFAYILVILHIIYMSLFTYCNISNYNWLIVYFNSSVSNADQEYIDTSASGVWIVWPVLLLVLSNLQIFIRILNVIVRHDAIRAIGNDEKYCE